MRPYRYYFIKDEDIDQAADFFECLPDFTVELNDVEEGYNHLMLTRTDSVRPEPICKH